MSEMNVLIRREEVLLPQDARHLMKAPKDCCEQTRKWGPHRYLATQHFQLTLPFKTLKSECLSSLL